MIRATKLIVNGNFEIFTKDLNQTILEMQNNGLNVEVQYTTPVHENSFIFTALLIGKENN